MKSTPRKRSSLLHYLPTGLSSLLHTSISLARDARLQVSRVPVKKGNRTKVGCDSAALTHTAKWVLASNAKRLERRRPMRSINSRRAHYGLARRSRRHCAMLPLSRSSASRARAKYQCPSQWPCLQAGASGLKYSPSSGSLGLSASSSSPRIVPPRPPTLSLPTSEATNTYLECCPPSHSAKLTPASRRPLRRTKLPTKRPPSCAIKTVLRRQLDPAKYTTILLRLPPLFHYLILPTPYHLIPALQRQVRGPRSGCHFVSKIKGEEEHYFFWYAGRKVT